MHVIQTNIKTIVYIKIIFKCLCYLKFLKKQKNIMEQKSYIFQNRSLIWGHFGRLFSKVFKTGYNNMM